MGSAPKGLLPIASSSWPSRQDQRITGLGVCGLGFGVHIWQSLNSYAYSYASKASPVLVFLGFPGRLATAHLGIDSNDNEHSAARKPTIPNT